LDRGDQSFSMLIWLPNGKNVFPFLLTAAKLLGDDQTISHGANTSFLFITHQYIGAANQIAPMYWCCNM
jgi:hypothetical protein